MHLFSSIFGSKDKIGYIKEIDGDLHNEIHFFLELEEFSHVKVELANNFASTWNKGDLSELKKHLQGMKSLIRKSEKLLPRFKQRIREQDSDLLQIVHLANTQLERREDGYIEEELKKLEQILDLEHETLTIQLQILDEPLDSLLLQRKKINKLLKAIQSEASILLGEKDLLDELQANISRLDAFQGRGLMTMHSLVEELQQEIVNNEILTQIYRIRKMKEEAERLILEKDFSSHRLIHIQQVISENVEGKLLSKLMLYGPRVTRIISILEKAKSKERYSQSNQKISILIETLGYIYKKETISKIKRYLAAEATAMKKSKFDKFMINYQEEKLWFWNFNKNLREIGAGFIIDEIIRAGFLISEGGNVFSRYIEQKSKGASLFDIFMLYTYLTVFAYLSIPTIIEEDKKKRKPQFKGDNLYTVIEDMENRSEEFEQSNVELSRELMQKYGIKIIGYFVEQDLIYLKETLEKYYPEEVRRFIKTVVFIKGRPKDYDVHYAGMYVNSRKEVRLFADWDGFGISHEIAHARTFELPAGFKTLWNEVNEGGIGYEELKVRGLIIEIDKDVFRWKKAYMNLSAYGYFRPYGTKDVLEDIATFEEGVMNLRRWKNVWLEKNPRGLYIRPYFDIYKNKANLLWKFGFITSEDYDQLMNVLKEFE